jgi:hypothetical protein
MPNISVILQAQWVITDTTLSPSPQIVQRSLNNPTLAATASFYDPFFQTINGTKTVNLPAATVWTVYVRNLSNTGPITVNFTPVGGGAATSIILVQGATPGNGGIFIYHQPAESSGGITVLTLTAAAILPACVLAAA